MASSSFYCVHVYVQCKPGTEEAFRAATLRNAQQSVQEQGILRFDVLQDTLDSTRFVLVEVYRDAVLAPAAHKETSHYAEWRDAVEDWMTVPRTYARYNTIFPTVASEWESLSSNVNL